MKLFAQQTKCTCSQPLLFETQVPCSGPEFWPSPVLGGCSHETSPTQAQQACTMDSRAFRRSPLNTRRSKRRSTALTHEASQSDDSLWLEGVGVPQQRERATLQERELDLLQILRALTCKLFTSHPSAFSRLKLSLWLQTGCRPPSWLTPALCPPCGDNLITHVMLTLIDNDVSGLAIELLIAD